MSTITPSRTGSIQPRKQRKYRYNIPLHQRKKLVSSHLAKLLRQQYKIRSIPVRKGDTVKIMRGTYHGKEGVIDSVNTKDARVYITGIERIKKDGSKTLVPIAASKILITAVHADKRRFP